uniref:Uncharacterized protein n=1 Tax=Octopus bimaculoides TaxID=37653 RepID=A0A0L8I1G6_OCTBM
MKFLCPKHTNLIMTVLHYYKQRQHFNKKRLIALILRSCLLKQFKNLWRETVKIQPMASVQLLLSLSLCCH